MCIALIGVPGGKLVKVTTNVAVAAVMLPPLSLVRKSVIWAVPLPDDSLLVTGGVSLAGNRVAVKSGLVDVDGALDEEQPDVASV
jgi:hypothetical protein